MTEATYEWDTPLSPEEFAAVERFGFAVLPVSGHLLDNEYTPTTEEVGIKYVLSSGVGEKGKAEFYRWLAVYTVEVQAVALREARDLALAYSNMPTDIAAHIAAILGARADSLHPVEEGK